MKASPAIACRSAAIVLIALVTSTCGDSGSDAPQEPTPAPGRWLGAQRIDGSPGVNANCPGALTPSAGMDGQGGVVATWLSNCAIWVARTSRGQAWGTPSILGELPPGAAPNLLWEPSLAVNRPGAALVAWAAQEPAASGRHLVSRRLDPLAGWTAAERIDAGEAGRLVSPYAASLALDPVANGLAAWDSEGVVAARLSAAGGWLIPERIAGVPSSAPRVFLDDAGRGFATWSLSGQAFVRRFEPGRGWGGTTAFAPDAGWSFVGAGEVAFDATGQALLVWPRSQASNLSTSVWSASFTEGRWSVTGQISASGSRASGPHVGIDANGRGIAVWNEPQVGITSARHERGAWSTPQLVASAPGAGSVRLAVSAGGDAMIAWREADATTGRDRVWAARYTAAAWGSRESLQLTSNSPKDPTVSIDPCGNAVAVWSELESGQYRIWANRFDAACP